MKVSSNLSEIEFKRVFEYANWESEVKNSKNKMANTIWLTKISENLYFLMKICIVEFLVVLIKNLMLKFFLIIYFKSQNKLVIKREEEEKGEKSVERTFLITCYLMIVTSRQIIII